MQVVGRVMREKGSGVMSNLATRNPIRARDEGAYLASLTGLIALTRQAARELSPYHVHVHAIGSGISEFHCAEAGIPRRFEEAVMYLCQSPLDGQIVDLEES